jgi:hypothetical protein
MKPMAEGVWLLTAMTLEYSWGAPIDQVVKRFSQLEAGAVEALRKSITIDSAGSLLLEPEGDAPSKPGTNVRSVRPEPVEE